MEKNYRMSVWIQEHYKPMATTINDLATLIADWAKDQGFSQDVNFAEKIALCHSELSEALEADRNDAMDQHLPQYSGSGVELADTIIRVLHLAALMGEPIGEIILAKMVFNETRQHKHGKKY